MKGLLLWECDQDLPRILTPLAGIGLIVVMVLASGFHITRRELFALPINFGPVALAGFVHGVGFAKPRFKRADVISVLIRIFWFIAIKNLSLEVGGFMKIGVSGASGHLGKSVLKNLIEERGSHSLVGVSRSPDTVPSSVDGRHGDYDKPESLLKA